MSPLSTRYHRLPNPCHLSRLTCAHQELESPPPLPLSCLCTLWYIIPILLPVLLLNSPFFLPSILTHASQTLHLDHFTAEYIWLNHAFAITVVNTFSSYSFPAFGVPWMMESHPAGFRPDLVLKPVIKELARTQVCFPDLKLLVDRISIVTLPSTEHTTANEAYRLYLTDGERTIQGMRILIWHPPILEP